MRMMAMRIAFVTPPGLKVLPPNQKSSGIWTYEVARRLSVDNEVTVFTDERKGPSEHWSEGVRYRFVSQVGVPRSVLHKMLRANRIISTRRRPVFSSPLNGLGYALQVARELKRDPPDYIHIHSYFQFVPIIKDACPAKVILHMHCDWLSQLDRRLIWRYVRKADVVISCSNFVTRNTVRRFPEISDRCFTVNPGVDPSLFSPGSKPTEACPSVLFVGRISPEKGIHVLLESFRILLQEEQGCKLFLVGAQISAPPDFIVRPSDDPQVRTLARFYPKGSRAAYASYLKHQVEKMGISDQVSFIPFLPHVQIPRWIRLSDVLVNPSFYESFGRSLVEGMSCGKPVIGTRTGGMTELVNSGKDGFLVRRGDAAGLAECMLRLIERPATARKMGQRGRRKVVRRYSWETIIRSFVKCLYAAQ